MVAHVVATAALLLAGVTPAVSPQRLSDHVRMLASDGFEGRGPGTAGEEKSVDYIVRQFAKAGLRPGGRNGSWTQQVPAYRFTQQGPIRAALASRAGTRALPYRDDAMFFTRNPGSRVDVRGAPLVFVGYAIDAPERQWDDFKGADLKGKIAVVLINEPDLGAETGPFDGNALTYHGMLKTKGKALIARGAIGALYIHDSAAAGWGWATAQTSWSQPQFDVQGDTPQPRLRVEGWLRDEVAKQVFADAGADLASLAASARSPDFRPVALDARLSVSFDYRTDRVETRNVLGLLPGRKTPGEYLIYTSHWDHLGRGAPEGGKDVIYNGAVDNATGTAAMLELARLFASGPRPDRSILFIATTLEEKGLLGARYYAENPVYPLAGTVAVLNIDALTSWSPARDMIAVGYGKSELDQLFEAALADKGRRVRPDPSPEVGAYFRSDHFPFAEQGVPSAFASSGYDLVAGGEEAGLAAFERYGTRQYHQPDDEWTPDWRFEPMADDVEIFAAVGRALAAAGRWPEWKPGAEFKLLRERMRGGR